MKANLVGLTLTAIFLLIPYQSCERLNFSSSPSAQPGTQSTLSCQEATTTLTNHLNSLLNTSCSVAADCVLVGGYMALNLNSAANYQEFLNSAEYQQLFNLAGGGCGCRPPDYP